MYNSADMDERIPVTIGVAGGTGSGKTTVATTLVQRVGPERIAYLQQDAYYKDLSGLPLAERARLNFDHPDAIETGLLVEHLQQLRRGEPAEVPIYDFTTYVRRPETRHVPPRPVILLEGLLILAEPAVRNLLDIKIYVDTDPDLRIIRRIRRDIVERGRSLDSVIEQYLNTVRPMHLEFVEPSKRYADVIVPEGGFNQVALDMIVARIEEIGRNNPAGRRTQGTS
jgi:uridine kinase